MLSALEFATLTSNMSTDKSLIKEWAHVSIEKYDNTRLYYKQLDEIGQGFLFYCLNFCSCGMGKGSVWEQPDLEIEIIAAGYGFFDGVRHLYFHSDELDDKGHQKFDGYLYYPNLVTIQTLFIELRKLELKYCRDAETYE